MMAFQRPEYLYLFAALPFLVWYLYFYQKSSKSRLDTFATEKILDRLRLQQNPKFKDLKSFWIVMFFICSVMAMTNPGKYESATLVNIDKVPIAIALDVSNSMKTEDVSPNRIEIAKLLTAQLIEVLKTEQISIIEFAGAADIVLPFTYDHNAALQQLALLSPDYFPDQGTDFTQLLSVFYNQLQSNDIKGGILIIVSDGEHQGESYKDMLERIVKRNIKIFTIGVGTEQGGYIPTAGNNLSAYKLDDMGNLVRSRLVNTTLTDLAQKSNGKYFYYQDIEFAKNIISSDVSSYRGAQLFDMESIEFKGWFRIFIALALISLISLIVLYYKTEY